jgi:hypothetical protein
MSASSIIFGSSGGAGLFQFSKSSSKKVLSKLSYSMKHHPIASNSFLCFNLWVVGDVLAQYSQHKLRLLPGGEEDEAASSSSSADATTLKEPSSLEHRSHQLVLDDTTNDNNKAKEPNAEKSLPFAFFSNSLDYTRTAQCASYGALVTGPLLAVWYPYMEKICVQHNMAARYGLWGAPIAKVLVDEFIMDPPTLVAFYGYMNICEGGSWKSFENKLRSEFMPSWLTSLAVWPIVLLGTFRFMPIYAQAPLINACCIVWDGFLSHRNSLSRAQERTNAAKEKVDQQQQQQQQ